MSRFSGVGAYRFGCRKQGQDYEIWWVFDRYYKGSRLRFPQSRGKWTDENGARRFCKKHNISWESVK